MGNAKVMNGTIKNYSHNPYRRVELTAQLDHTDHYWQVYFDTNKTIRATFGATGYAVPEAHVHHRTG